MMVKDKYRYEMRKGNDELMTKRSRWSVRSNRISWGKRSRYRERGEERGGPLGQKSSQGIHIPLKASPGSFNLIPSSTASLNSILFLYPVHHMKNITADTLTMQKIQSLPLSTLALARWNLLDNLLLFLGSLSHPIKVSFAKLFSCCSSLLFSAH